MHDTQCLRGDDAINSCVFQTFLSINGIAHWGLPYECSMSARFFKASVASACCIYSKEGQHSACRLLVLLPTYRQAHGDARKKHAQVSVAYMLTTARGLFIYIFFVRWNANLDTRKNGGVATHVHAVEALI